VKSDLLGILQTIRVKRQKFLMGSEKNSPGRSKFELRLEERYVFSDFELGRYPVTNLVWSLVTGEQLKGDPLRPKTNLTWGEAVEFCVLLNQTLGLKQPAWRNIAGEWQIDSRVSGFRLPFEVEWECACRAGTIEDRYGPLQDIAWTLDSSIAWTPDSLSEGPKPVGLKQPNPWGFYDMLGNTWEWCWEEMRELPPEMNHFRLMKGGSCDSFEKFSRAGARGANDPTIPLNCLGFRLARTAEL